MQRYQDCPLILRDFLSYHETIKGQSQQTIAEYYLDLRMFLRFMKLVKNELPIDTDLSSISIKDIDIRLSKISHYPTSMTFFLILPTTEKLQSQR